MDRPYIPISCSVHDEFLAAATLRRECTLVILDADGGERQIRGIISDVYSRFGAEYLELRDGTTLRLDAIVSFDGRPVPPA